MNKLKQNCGWRLHHGPEHQILMEQETSTFWRNRIIYPRM